MSSPAILPIVPNKKEFILNFFSFPSYSVHHLEHPFLLHRNVVQFTDVTIFHFPYNFPYMTIFAHLHNFTVKNILIILFYLFRSLGYLKQSFILNRPTHRLGIISFSWLCRTTKSTHTFLHLALNFN